jgi:hypothetical protein
MIEGTRKMMSHVVGQGCRLRRLAEAFVFPMPRVDAHLPGFLVDIQTDVNRLTRKIKFVTLNHGKSPFSVIFLQQQNYIRVYETCLPFSIIRSELVSASDLLFLLSADATFTPSTGRGFQTRS